MSSLWKQRCACETLTKIIFIGNPFSKTSICVGVVFSRKEGCQEAPGTLLRTWRNILLSPAQLQHQHCRCSATQGPQRSPSRLSVPGHRYTRATLNLTPQRGPLALLLHGAKPPEHEQPNQGAGRRWTSNQPTCPGEKITPCMHQTTPQALGDASWREHTPHGNKPGKHICTDPAYSSLPQQHMCQTFSWR